MSPSPINRWFGYLNARVELPPGKIDLSRHASLARIDITYLSAADSKEFSWIPSLLATIVTPANSHISITFGPEVSAEAELAAYMTSLEESRVLELIDSVLVRSQSADGVKPPKSVEVRLILEAHLCDAADDGLAFRRHWANFARQKMLRCHERGILRCTG